jgi:hypothetical protein
MARGGKRDAVCTNCGGEYKAPLDYEHTVCGRKGCQRTIWTQAQLEGAARMERAFNEAGRRQPKFFPSGDGPPVCIWVPT